MTNNFPDEVVKLLRFINKSVETLEIDHTQIKQLVFIRMAYYSKMLKTSINFFEISISFIVCNEM
jgi:hypothetical protein